MFKRVLLAIACACMFSIAAPAASAMSPGDETTDFDFDGQTASDDIWIGMCLGASLDLSQATQKSCERQRKARPALDTGNTSCTQYEQYD